MPASNIFQNFAQGQQMAGQRELQQQQIEGNKLQRQQEFMQLNDQRKGAMFQDARAVNSFLKSGQPEQALNTLSNRLGFIEQFGGDPTDTREIADLIARGDIQGATNLLDVVEKVGMQEVNQSTGNPFLQDLTPKGEDGKVTANIADFLFHEKLIKNGKQDEADAFANKAGLSKLSPQEQAQLTLETAGLKQREKERTTRLGGFVNSGVGAADGVKNIRRSLELLKTVKTGGFDKAALAAKQMFGIESADEGELSNNLGTNVLSQLKTIFGSAFTEKEGLRLERLEAGIGKSPAANKRILEKALEMTTRAAKRGGRAAKELKDDFAFEEIQLALDDALNSNFNFNQQTQAAGTAQVVEQQGGQIMTDANGNRAMVFPDGSFKEL
jgi:hypothetical protein